MKKVFTIVLACLFGLHCSAATDDTFVYLDADGNELADGAEITVSKVEEDVFFGDLLINPNLKVKNSGSEDADLRIDYQIKSIPGGKFQICFPTSCLYNEAAGQFSTPSGTVKGGKSQAMLTEWILDKEKTGTCTVVYQIIKMADGNDVAKGRTLTVNFVYNDEAAIDNVENTAAAEVVRYNLSGQMCGKNRKGLNIVRLSNGKVVKVLNK